MKDIQRIRTIVRTLPLVSPLVHWGWGEYVTAIAINAPNDCAEIPKVAGAGRHVSDSEGDYQLMHNGIKIRLGSYYDDINAVIIEKLQGHHEPQEELVFYKVLQQLPENPVMIEAGSYWGYYSLWFKKEKPAGCVYLIEPLDQHLEAGRMNFAANGMEGNFFKAYVGSSSEPPHTLKMEGSVVKDVERITIDDFMESHDISHLHLLHADVQGAELDLLKGCEKALGAGKVGYIFISTHGGSVHNECMDLLARQNYRIIANHTRDESFTTDGLIVARSNGMEGIDEVVISKKKSGFAEDLSTVVRYSLSKFFNRFSTRDKAMQRL